MRRRQAFTLVELLVAMALIMFIMAILSTAFAAATGTFRNLKALGDMAEKLRATTQILQRDLAADHFEGKKRLSDPNFWSYGPPQQGFFRIWQNSMGITEGSDLDGIGSFRSTDHALAFTIKMRGNQMGDFPSASAAGGGSVLSLITGFGPPESRYQITPSSSYSYQWAEVTWFLQPSLRINSATGQPELDTTAADTDAGTTPVPLYTLYRRQRLLVPDNTQVPQQVNGNIGSFQEISCWSNGPNLYFNTPIDITVPQRRFGMDPSNPAGLLYATQSYPGATWPFPPPNGPWYPPNAAAPTYQTPAGNLTPYYPALSEEQGGLAGADIQLTDVISFDVRVLVQGATGGVDPYITVFSLLGNYNNNNPLFYQTTNPLAPAVFDTWTSVNDNLSNYSQWNSGGQATSIPLWNGTSGPIILAVQVSIRIWDLKTNQTRQVTIVQAM